MSPSSDSVPMGTGTSAPSNATNSTVGDEWAVRPESDNIPDYVFTTNWNDISAGRYNLVLVRVGSVTDFGGALQDEYKSNMTPYWPKITDKFDLGAQFSHAPTVALTDKRSSYGLFLELGKALVSNAMQGLDQLSGATQTIGDKYSGADQFSSVTMNDVLQQLPDPKAAVGAAGAANGTPSSSPSASGTVIVDGGGSADLP